MAESSSSGDSSSSKSLLWMMIALFVGVAGLLGGGLFMANRMVGSVGLAAASSKDIIRTPAGNLHLEKQNDVGPGLPVYSNASLVLPSDKSAAIAIQERNSGITSVTYHTRDTRDSVDLWYSKHLSAEFARHDAGENPLPDVLREGHVSEGDISFLAQRGRQVRIVSLSLDTTGGTFISLVRFDKSPGQ